MSCLSRLVLYYLFGRYKPNQVVLDKMDEDVSECSLAYFQTWKVEALKAFLSKRGLKIDGNKLTLV